MKLNLTKPIVFLDIESTGLNVLEDKIIELSMCKLHPNLQREIKTYRYNPELKMSEEVIKIHGITNEMLENCPFFKQHAKGIVNFLNGCDIAGFNSNVFDIPLLYSEISRAGVEWNYKQHSIVDVGNIFKINEPRSLTGAVKFYNDKEHTGAHSAEADVLATIDVFIAQLEKYELPKEVDELAFYSNYEKQIVDLGGKFTTDNNNEIILNFGKHKGQPAKNHLDFISWMLAKGNFAKDTIQTCEFIMKQNGAI